LIDAALVAAAFEIRRKECGHASFGHLYSDESGTKGDRIGVIVLSGEDRRQRLSHLRAAARRVAIGGDCDSDPRSANGDPPLSATVGQSFGEQCAEARIIDAFVAMGAKVDDVVALLAEPSRKLVLEVDAGMVGGEYDVHDS
jgi:hypothetical protein